jgi:hypothetical protein
VCVLWGRSISRYRSYNPGSRTGHAAQFKVKHAASRWEISATCLEIAKMSKADRTGNHWNRSLKMKHPQISYHQIWNGRRERHPSQGDVGPIPFNRVQGTGSRTRSLEEWTGPIADPWQIDRRGHGMGGVSMDGISSKGLASRFARITPMWAVVSAGFRGIHKPRNSGQITQRPFTAWTEGC